MTGISLKDRVYRNVTAYSLDILKDEGFIMDFAKQAKLILTDSHFLVPFCVLIAGIMLLVVLH